MTRRVIRPTGRDVRLPIHHTEPVHASVASDRILDRVFCLAILAYSKDEVQRELKTFGFEEQRRARVFRADRFVAAGYLGTYLEHSGLGLQGVENHENLKIGKIERSMMAADGYFYFEKYDIHAWFMKVTSREDPAGRYMLCISGTREKLVTMLQDLVKKWRRMQFDTYGIRTDVEHALGYLEERLG